MRSPKHTLTRIALCCVALWISACVPNTTDSVGTLPTEQDQVILVGKIQIIPEIPQYMPDRGMFANTTKKVLEDRIVTAFSPKLLRPKFSSLGGIYGKATRSLPLNQTFYISVPRSELYLMEGFYFTSAEYFDQLRFPGGLSTRPTATTDVLYIGTVQYYRGDFYEITDVKIRDEYARTVGSIKSRYGADTTITKNLLN